jgi:hypothetical protein
MLTVVLNTLVCSLTGCTTTYPKQTVAVADVEAKIDRSLPIGTTRSEIEAWLVGQQWEFGYSDRPTEQSDVRREPDANKYRGVIFSLIRDTDQSSFVTGNIQVYFLLDTDGRLARRLVKWVGTGL